ncbi:hypothetical protein R1sor_001076 [Riccia sorocarpa]|uniref:Uncharacterized protein n=1 Tax=Riccia sorocarpa TaxID=122646 RepID=A0ABD3GXH9_9MARC
MVNRHRCEPRWVQKSSIVYDSCDRGGFAAQEGTRELRRTSYCGELAYREMTNLSLSVLYHGTFKHHLPGDHVDEIRFDETVTISAIEITDFRAREDYKSLSSLDGSTGSGLPVDIFFRVEGAECFKRLNNPFRFYPSAPPLYDDEASADDYGSYWNVEETETDHIVLRGTHDYLTLIVYGN